MLPAMHDRPHPSPLHEHAAADLRFIRDTMARAADFTAVPGWGGVAIGITAILTAAWAGPPTASLEWLAAWLVEAALAVAIGTEAVVRKARASRVPLDGRATRRFLLAFLPSLVAGAVLTAAFVRAGLSERLPGCWLLCYGAGVVSGGAFSVRPVLAMGVSFMALGVITLVVPSWWGTFFMAAGFGLLHIGFGIVIARNHGG
jgi:hypothetical protein